MTPRALVKTLAFLTLFAAGLLYPPSAEAAKIKIGDDPTLGNRDASLVLVEFADYQ